MEISTMPSAVSLPSYFVNYSSGTILASLQANYSKSHLLTILTHTTAHSHFPGQNSEQGSKSNLSDNEEDEDSFGEHYFHICIYIWACVVISSLIALSVKWGCCGRSLTRWEVKRIPLKRFQRVEGEDSQEKCPICHEEFHEERLIRQLPCNHCYHSYCVDRWLVKMSNRCPLCKQRVSISLLCPWNKQRRKKEINGHHNMEMEASVDESPPLPPLATLTPSNWYGEEIMSGPSKFIILRPGRPTRVIDIREKLKNTASSKNNSERGDRTLQLTGVSAVTYNPQNFEEIVTEQNCDTDIHDNSNINNAVENIVSARSFLEADVLKTDIHIPSACSSRSCSISSDQPLFFQNQSSFDNDRQVQGVRELTSSCESLKWISALTPLLHSQENSNNEQCCTRELDCKHLPRMKEFEQKNLVKPVVTLSSRSNSVVSCNIKTSDTKTELFNPSIAHLITENPSTTLDRSECITGCRSPVLAFYNKHHTLPGSVTEFWNLCELDASNVPDNCIHGRFSKSDEVSETASIS